MPVLTFDASTHTYTAGGRRVPSVTQVLEGCGIIDYSSIPDGTRVMALERGRMVHLLTQYHDEGDLDDATVPEYLAPYLAAWQRFRAETGFSPTLIEHRGYCDAYGYAGTLDRTGRMSGYASEILLDIKTSVAPWWAAVQTAAYARLFDSPARFTRCAVALHADGSYKLDLYRSTEFQQHWRLFLAALAIHRAKENARA